MELVLMNMNKLKLSTLPWYISICAEDIPFSALSNKDFNIILSRNQVLKLRL